jgi:hypothetical protein
MRANRMRRVTTLVLSPIIGKHCGLMPDRECVTSHSCSLEGFDAKGNRPCAETEALFRQTVSEIHRQWRLYRTQR